MNEDIKNIKEILELADDELVKNNEETFVTLDYEDLKSLKKLYELYIESEAKNEKLKRQSILSAKSHIENTEDMDKMSDLFIEDMQKNGLYPELTPQEIYRKYYNRARKLLKRDKKWVKKTQEKLRWERDYYKLRFEELNKHWHNIKAEILGENYYNLGCSWDTCDDLAEEDLLYAYNHTTRFKRFVKKLKKKIIKLLEG